MPSHQTAANQLKQQLTRSGKPASSERQANLASANEGDDDDDDEEQDSEALLYRMMQQQGFLLNPTWQEAASGKSRAPSSQAQVGRSQPEVGDHAASMSNQLVGEGPSSKRMIKLLKSYSHIHQVDDSDDQIRGSHTRVAASGPQMQAGGWKPSAASQTRQR